MAEVMLFHHVLGVTDGVGALADELRAAGHTVHTPDLFDGATFATIEDGAANAEGIGFPVLIERGMTAADAVAGPLVPMGISLGVLSAQAVAQTRAGVPGAILLEGCVPPSEFGEGWPDGVAVQVQGMADDPFFAGEGDLEVARELVAAVAPTARAELHVHPGDGHLFLDRSTPAWDEPAATAAVAAMIDFLAVLG
ncbi:MAG: dienelactone hydrolase family protein [Actinomycetota bacterium]